ncbi:MAG TPA: aminopeptidase [Cyclobacteriaceae bacterium]|nr:aminopeptidase [Cyclobacteriaceae bacterium]HRJ83071.1 aminopeptidase [Cyclobacteriaceae bacterium]
MSRIVFKVLKWLLVSLASLLIILCLIFWDLVAYGYRQAKGQLHIVWNAKPVEVYLADPAFPDSLKNKLRFVEEVRKYAIDSLGLKDSKNYKTLFDQKGEEIMWVVTASEPFQLKEKQWRFPVLGDVPYKGFFEKERALAEQKKLEQAGFDVNVRNPGGWSTLGWFTDPILSNMLLKPEGDLASLIIHEMVHATIFVKDSIDFNENLASFIGDRGAEKFLINKYGGQSEQYLAYIQEDKEFLAYVDHILRGCIYLDSVYTAIAGKSHQQKQAIKENAIRTIMESADSLSFKVLAHPSKRHAQALPNNAYFMSFRRYQSRQDDFWTEWREAFNGDLKAYIDYLSKRHPFL